MPVFREKLLELTGIVHEAGQSYLLVTLSFEQHTKWRWSIDDDTAAQLESIADFEGTAKYRLSFHTDYNPIQQQYTSFITRTYLDQSDRFYFCCSENYVNGIQSIKNLQLPKELLQLSYLTSLETTSLETRPILSPMVRKSSGSKRFLHKISWATAIVIMCTIITLAISYFGPTYGDSEPGEISIANAETYQDSPRLTNKATLAEAVPNAVTPEPEVTLLSSSPELSEFETVNEEPQPNLPAVTLEEGINFKLPLDSVALTFDDGPSPHTLHIMNILNEYQVGGTFFFIGQNVVKHPDIVKDIYNAGYSIGNHSMNHVHLTQLNSDEQAVEWIDASQLIENITSTTTKLLRPPFGAKNEDTDHFAADHQNKVVLWNNDPKDWAAQNAEEVFNNVTQAKTAGAIILLHESQKVVDALPQIIEYLQKQDLNIVGLK